jgi:tetratricopeptide (TPR) repeat protein
VLVERSAGNPLFGEEILGMLIDLGVLRATTDGWELVSDPAAVEVPRSIRAVIGARLDALPAEEKEVLQAAAVVGRVFWVGAVQRLAQRGRRETRELLRGLRHREILLPHEDSSFSGEPELAFKHVLIRDVAYESLPKTRRVDAHVEIANWAAEHAAGREDEIAELLATHHLRALSYLEELGEHDGRRDLVQPQAYRWARAAGERAHRLWQQREAARWYHQALEAANGIDVGPQERAALWETYAHACEGVEPYAKVARAFEAALALYVELGDDAAAGRMEAWRAFVAFQTGDDEDVLHWSRRALGHLEPRGNSRDLALALIIVGWAHRRSGRFDEAEPLLRRAAAIAATVGDAAISAQASVSLGKCLQQSGDPAQGVPLLEHSLELARQAGDLPVLLRALVDLSEAHEEATGDYRRAEQLMREGLELARRAGHRQQVAWMESNLADYLVDMGRLGEADELTHSGLDEARHIGEPRRIALTLPTVSFLALLHGQLAEAQRSLDELRAVSAQVREVYAAPWAALLEGLLAQARGRQEAAAEVLLDGARRQAGRTEIWGSVSLLAESVRCLAHLGRLEDAREPRGQLAALATWSAPAAAFLAWADGLLEPEPGRALAELRRAASLFERLGRRVELGRCLVDVASAEIRLRRDPGPTLADARTIFEDCGATLLLGEVAEVEKCHRRQRARSSAGM